MRHFLNRLDRSLEKLALSAARILGDKLGGSESWADAPLIEASSVSRS